MHLLFRQERVPGTILVKCPVRPLSGVRWALLHKSPRDSLFESRVVAGDHEQLVPYEVQDQELAFVQYGAEAARFAINLV